MNWSELCFASFIFSGFYAITLPFVGFTLLGWQPGQHNAIVAMFANLVQFIIFSALMLKNIDREWRCSDGIPFRKGTGTHKRQA